MTTTIRTLIRTLSAAALLAAATLSLPAGARAAGKNCTMPKNVPGVGGTTYPDGGTHTDGINGKTYICDNGSWIIITDEKLDPGTPPPPPPRPQTGVTPRPGGGVLSPR